MSQSAILFPVTLAGRFPPVFPDLAQTELISPVIPVLAQTELISPAFSEEIHSHQHSPEFKDEKDPCTPLPKTKGPVQEPSVLLLQPSHRALLRA